METNIAAGAWPSYSFRAMGSQIAFWLEAEPREAAEAFWIAEGLFNIHERILSRFDPESELSQLNGRSGEWVGVSPLLWEVAAQALLLAEMTGGLFDPTLLNALEAAGYTHSFEAGINPFAQSQAEPGRWAEVGLDPLRRAVWLPPGVRLDLGGIAKGFTAQQAANWLAEWGPCLVDAGGDLTARDAPAGYPGWPAAISAPWTGPEQAPADLFDVWLANGSLATSGIDYRRWRQNGRFAHHLIHPATGRPADTDALTATVLAETAVKAEAWATTALICGLEDGAVRLCEQNMAGLLIGNDGRIALTPSIQPLVRQRW